jgi:hypothetical protein
MRRLASVACWRGASRRVRLSGQHCHRGRPRGIHRGRALTAFVCFAEPRPGRQPPGRERLRAGSRAAVRAVTALILVPRRPPLHGEEDAELFLFLRFRPDLRQAARAAARSGVRQTQRPPSHHGGRCVSTGRWLDRAGAPSAQICMTRAAASPPGRGRSQARAGTGLPCVRLRRRRS